MIVRLGYVAMSVHLQNASPSKTMTYKTFQKIADPEAAKRKLALIASENLHHTLRILRHNRYSEVAVYRFSSKLIPLFTHDALQDWDPITGLRSELRELGAFVTEHGMRVSFHPDHFTVFSTPRAEVLRHAVRDMDKHVQLLEAMGLGLEATCNIHIGGTYGNKEKAFERFIAQFTALDVRIRERVTLENDDKTFTAAETLAACEILRVPMVLDLHHHRVNHNGEDAASLWPRILQTWEPENRLAEGVRVPPKIHISSPKDAKSVRSHADYVNPDDLFPFLEEIAPQTPAIDVMIEAKQKDDALFQLMRDAAKCKGVKMTSQASFEM